ncbi:MAG: 2-dehydropantoate 2-reductase [Prevotella sp.]|nr:2-dehydropantoate 2-reductase [Prevotella sp.]
MKYGIIGTGAIGGYYGAKLARAGHDVHFLLHTDYDHVLSSGLRIDSCDGDFRLERVCAYASSADMPQCDIVLVGLKSVNNRLLPDLLRPVLHSRTLVVLIQNGIGLEADLQAAMPGVWLAAGLAFICSAKVGPGHIAHQCYGNINIGNYSCPDASLVDALIADLKDAGVGAAAVEYDEARWRKAVWNMPFNGLTVALDTRTDRLLECPSTLVLVKEMMMEVVGAARALGVSGVTEAFADKMIRNTMAMTPYSPSMKLDYDNHRPMEIDYLYTRPIAEARRVGFDMPRLSMLEAALRFKELAH